MLRDVGQREYRLLAGTEKGESPFFAPDGEWIRARDTTAVPTSNADIAPTIMHLMGLTPAPSMTGRVLAEVLRSRRGSNRPRVRRDSVQVCQSLTGTDITELRVTLQRSCVGATMYADSTVTRRTVHGEAIGFLQAREDAVGHPPPRLGNPAEVGEDVLYRTGEQIGRREGAKIGDHHTLHREPTWHEFHPYPPVFLCRADPDEERDEDQDGIGEQADESEHNGQQLPEPRRDVCGARVIHARGQ